MRLSHLCGRFGVAAVVAGAAVSAVLASTPASGANTGSVSTAARAEGAKKAQVTVIARRLNNPRGIAVGPAGQILVAEAGSGGPGPQCVVSPENGEKACIGLTGSVTAIAPQFREAATKAEAISWRQWRPITGLPSVAVADGSSALGLHDLGLGWDGRLVGTLGLGGNLETRKTLGPKARLLGHLVALRHGHAPTPLADLTGYEARKNPDKGEVDSNPYGLFVGPLGTVATDAGGNDVLGIDRKGKVSTLAVLPDRPALAPPFLGLPPGTKIPAQAVPTSVVRGPDGAFYVGQLTGFPFPFGGAAVWRFEPGRKPTIVARGFTNIIDIAFDRQGRLLVLQISKKGLLDDTSTAGALYRVDHKGHKTEIAPGALTFPGGVAVGPDGALYVTNKSILKGAGEVLRIRA